MKKVFNKTFAAIMLAIAMVLALFGGLFFAGHGEVASADGAAIDIKFEADTKVFSKGKKFDVTVTLTPNIDNSIFKALVLYVGALKADKTGYDADKCSQLTISSPTNALVNNPDYGNWSDFFPINVSENLMLFQDYSQWYESGYTQGNALLSVSDNDNISTITGKEEIKFKFSVTIGSGVAENTTFTFGIAEINANQVSYSNTASGGNDYYTANDSAAISIEPLTFTVREPKSDNNLSSIKVGQGKTETELETLNTSSTSLAITVKDPLKPISILPTASDAEGATIKVKKTSDSTDTGTEVKSGEISKFEIPADGKLSIIVTAEDGSTKTYNLTVTVVGATLTALTAKSDTKVTGTNEGVQETFDSKTLAYTVIVPSDATKVAITATVSTGNSASTTMALSKTGSCTIPSTATSGTAFDVTGVADGDKLTIKAQADNGAGTKSETAYVVTFDVKDVDVAITLTVVGKTTNKTFANDATKATDKGVDYFYLVAGETNAASDVTISFPTTATEVTLDSVAYTASKTLAAGEHTVFVKAEAGNTKEYKFILKAYTALQLKSGVTADFVYEKLTDTNVYVRTYKQDGLTHGKDDLGFDRFVIGQIEEKTSVNQFLANFETSVANNLKLYKADGTLIYNMGSPADGFSESDLNLTNKGVGTSWKLEYIVDGDVEETVYLSVFGDLNGDGKIDTRDITEVGKIIKGAAATIANLDASVEVRLAAYLSGNNAIFNDKPQITAVDIPVLVNHIKEIRAVSSYFYSA